MQQPALTCPKCRAPMLLHNRNGVQVEQCSGCRGIFLDFGELEALTQLQGQWMQQQQQYQQAQQMPPMGYSHGHHKPHKRGFMGMLFSS